MAWIVDTYAAMHPGQLDALGCVTGKPLGQGGVKGRREATGRGLFYAIREACSHADDMKALGLTTGLEGKRVVVQGLGNVGYHAAKFCREAGALVIAIAEREGAILEPEGPATRRRSSSTARAARPSSPSPAPRRWPATAAALELECDILIPAALENQFTADNAPRVKAKIILEGANGPTTPDADPIFRQKGILVIPDIYANAGGVTVLLLRVAQEPVARALRADVRSGTRRPTSARCCGPSRRPPASSSPTSSAPQLAKGPDELDLVNSGLEETMITAYNGLRETRKVHPDVPDLRTAAFLTAIHKVARSYMELGNLP